MLFLIFITKNMKEKSGFLITHGPLRPPRALRDDFSYVFFSIPLNFKLLRWLFQGMDLLSAIADYGTRIL
jgi:hypothetical protein